MGKKIKIKILKIDPESTYNGKNYGYFLTVELHDGTRIPVMDYFNRTNEGMINKEINALIIVSPTDPVTKNGLSEYFIRALVFDNVKTGHWVIISGLIENDDVSLISSDPTKFRTFSVNVGTGNILLHMNRDSSTEFRRGDIVSTTGIASLVEL